MAEAPKQNWESCKKKEGNGYCRDKDKFLLTMTDSIEIIMSVIVVFIQHVTGVSKLQPAGLM